MVRKFRYETEGDRRTERDHRMLCGQMGLPMLWTTCSSDPGQREIQQHGLTDCVCVCVCMHMCACICVCVKALIHRYFTQPDTVLIFPVLSSPITAGTDPSHEDSVRDGPLAAAPCSKSVSTGSEVTAHSCSHPWPGFSHEDVPFLVLGVT